MKNVVMYYTKASAKLATLIGAHLNISPCKIIRDRFDDGELYHRLPIENWYELIGKSVIMVGSTQSDRDFNELVDIGYTAARNSAAKVIFIIPFYGYATMDRAVKPGEAVKAKYRAMQLSNIPRAINNYFFIFDPHNSGIVDFFEGDCHRHEVYGEVVLHNAIKKLGLKNFVIGTADLSRAKWAETFAKKFETDIVLARKTRAFKKVRLMNIIGKVKNKVVVIYDDMTRSGDTLIQAAEGYLHYGAKAVYAVLSHLALNNQMIIEKLEKSPITKIITTNSHPMSGSPLVIHSGKIIVVDISQVYADLIEKILIH